MVQKLTPSQFRSKMRQIEQKRRQAINKYNQAVRNHNRKVKKAIDDYNRKVREYNARQRSNRQKILNELNKLKSKSSSSSHVVYRTSVRSMHQSYIKLENKSESQNLNNFQNYIYDLSEKETANSLQVTNSILGDSSEDYTNREDLQNVKISNELSQISTDLNDRWCGAVFSLNPNNPDASRHFCTSAREIITRILSLKASDEDVVNIFPNCDRTQEGNPTRRSKIKYLLHQKELSDGELEEFVDEDINNIIELFKVFNDATHGGAGTFSINQLYSIKTRVEDSISFLTELVN